MSDQEKKPREFWIGLNESVIYTKNDFVELPTKEDPGPFVHVIEHSAYGALQAKLAEAQAALEFYANGEHVHEYGGSNYTEDGKECPNYAEPESVSGEPANYREGHGDYGYEDGSIARAALAKLRGNNGA